jgi:hypothetical protein
MKDAYKAVEVSATGMLRVLELSVSEHGAGQAGFELKRAESVTRMSPRSLAATPVWICRAFVGMKSVELKP